MGRYARTAVITALVTVGGGIATLGLAALLDVGYSGTPKDSSDQVKATLQYVQGNARAFPTGALAIPEFSALQNHYELRSVPLPQKVQGNSQRTQSFSDAILAGLDREYGCQAMVKPGFDEQGAPNNTYVTVAFHKSNCKEVIPK